MTDQLVMTITLTRETTPSGVQWAALWVEHDVAACGDSPQAACDALFEAIALSMAEREEMP